MTQGGSLEKHWSWLLAALAASTCAAMLWWVLGSGFDWPSGLQRQTVLIEDAAYRINAREWRGARGMALRALSAAEAQALLDLEAELERHLEPLFQLPRDQVSAAADWYFSLPGQLVRAGTLLGADPGPRLTERLFPPEAWSDQQAMMLASLAAAADDHVHQTGELLLTTLHRELRERRQPAQPAAEVPAFSFELGDSAFVGLLQQDPVLERQAFALASGALVAVATRRATQAAAARAAGRQVGTGLTAACVSTGLAAWMCAAGAFGVTLLSTEVVLMRLDEAQNRGEFEAALHAELHRIEAEFAARVREAYLSALTRTFEARQHTLREGLRPVDLLFGLSSNDRDELI